MKGIKKTGFLNAFATALYITAVVTFMNYGSQIKIGKANALLAPIALLMLLVLSVAITGFLVFGKPALMYIDGKKKEALSLLAYTLSFFSVFTAIAILILISFTR